jgi:hypothetical protein
MAYEDGKVSTRHVDTIRQLADKEPDDLLSAVEPTLVQLAVNANPEDVRHAAEHIQQWVHFHPDGDGDPDDASQVLPKRQVNLNRFGDMWRLSGQLDAATGAAFKVALEGFMPPPAPDDDRSPAQRRHDAFADLVNDVLHREHTSTVAGSRPQIGVLMPYGLLESLSRRRHPAPPETAAPRPSREGGVLGPDPAVLEGFGVIPGRTAERLLCDAELFRVVLDERGLPLDVGRTYRTAPPWIRKALWARDGRCRWPGCGAQHAFTDAHHLRHWKAHDGSTAIGNLVLLCRYHHMRVHEGGWQLHFDQVTGEVTVTRPDGTPYGLPPSRPRGSWMPTRPP